MGVVGVRNVHSIFSFFPFCRASRLSYLLDQLGKGLGKEFIISEGFI